MAEREGLVLPAWRGPDKLFVLSKGKAYTFGLFALTPGRIAFANGGALLFDEARQDVTAVWPWMLGGGACRLRAPSSSCIVAFGRPFPDAPAPDKEEIESAAALIESAKGAASQLSDVLDLGVGVLGDLIVLAQAVGDLRKGRRAAEQVKAALAA